MSSRQYIKLSHLDHILKRPDSYVGSIQNLHKERWVTKDGSIQHLPCETIPALHTIFDEIVVNALDNTKVPANPTTVIRVWVNESGIRVANDGRCIPVVKQDGVYVPTMIFGQLLTSEHFDDTQVRTTGGLNGYGAKLTNIYSSEFKIECFDDERHLMFSQSFKNNMRKTNKPSIRKKKKNSFTTSVSFVPDRVIFGEWYTERNVSLFYRRVLDIAAISGVKVYWNGKRQKLTFKKYCSMYTPKATVVNVNGWDVGLGCSPDDSYTHVSFVNGIATDNRGTHVDFVMKQVAAHIQTILKKRNKKSTSSLSRANIRNKCFVFVNATVPNPHFNSQTKERLTTEMYGHGVKLTLEQVEKMIQSCGLLQALETVLQEKEMHAMQRKMNGKQKKHLKGIPKLSDASCAGTTQSKYCSLIVTEGDSAAAMATAGLSVVGRKHYGVFPLKGKLLNVRNASKKSLLQNKEIQNVMKILGLQLGKQYTDTSALRYGHLIIMTDQDVDGFHIVGLLLNFIHFFWPSLTSTGFIKRFVTPLVKCKKKEFFDVPTFHAWHENHPTVKKIKYYKGLGTSTNKEAKEYFSNLDKYVKNVSFDDAAADSLQLAFDSKLSKERKEWLATGEQKSLDYKKTVFPVHDFIHSELLQFSLSSVQRAIPSAVDGLKESQRKILFGATLKNKEMKVAQLAAFIADKTMYMHGEQSLCQAIVKLAQNFVGSNNVPLLVPNGQFGSRQQNGSDSASPRYIYTALQPYTSVLFDKRDNPLLTYRMEEGVQIEPEWYVPVLPMVLVNGANGIATGYISHIVPYHVKDIINNLRCCLRGLPLQDMSPYVKGYKGEISKEYETTGVYSISNHRVVTVTELPLGVSILQYKTFLMKSPIVQRFEEKHEDEQSIHFKIVLNETPKDVQAALKLKKKMTQSFYLLNEHGRIQDYKSPLGILKTFFTLRMQFMEKRLTCMRKGCAAQLKELH